MRDLDPDADSQIAFQFHIQASATVLTRSEFIAQQTESALKLRDSILVDTTASHNLVLLAADRELWIASYLGAIETAGLLREEDDAPPVRENPLVLSMMATLASGILIGAAGEQIITDGDLLGFFSQLRTWYGHNEELLGQNAPPPREAYDLNTSNTTHYEAFNIYVPFGEQKLDLPPGTSVPLPNFATFLEEEGTTGNNVSITGPVGSGDLGYVPAGATLPYTIQFANAPNASEAVGEVRIVTELDENLDPRTFRLGDLQLGNIKVNIPEERGSFEGDFDFSGTKGFILRVSAGNDPLSNTATWLLQAIDPQTGEVITNPDLGLLLPNNANGDGSGFVSYTVQPSAEIATETEISATARILYNNAPPLDTDTVINTVDAVAPSTEVTVEALTEGGSDYLVSWTATDGEETTDSSGVRHVTVYVAEDGGDFTIWKRQTSDPEGVFIGEPGKSYEFLALATDIAGNQELPVLGTTVPEDGSSTNLGTLPTVGTTSEPTPIPAPPPSGDRRTNPVFTEARDAIPNTLESTSEFDTVLRPFKATAFARDIPQSHGGISTMAILELPDGEVLVSGGRNRGSLYKLDRVGGSVGSPLVELPVPIFEMELDRNGTIWATTGGGALVQLDSETGEIIGQYGDGITQSLAIDGDSDLIYLSSGDGIEIFDTVTQTFTHFSNLRVGHLEFDNFGNLWGTRWPDRGEVVRFVPKPDYIGQQPIDRLDKKPQSVFNFDLPIDSLAFGKQDTELDNLLFISSNSGELLMVDLATRDSLVLADGGSRGDIVETTEDGRLFVSQSGGVDVFSPIIAPQVAFTNPPPDGIVALPQGTIRVTFDQEMTVGEGADSVLNPDNYTLIGETNGNLTPVDISYDSSSNTATLSFNALATDKYSLAIAPKLTNTEGVALEEAYSIDFTAVSDFSAVVDLEFSNTRSDRSSGTVSFDVNLTNTGEYDLLLPLALLLQPDNNTTAEPLNSTVTESGGYLVDLSSSLDDGILSPEESVTGHTVTIDNPDNLRFDFTPAIYTLPTANEAPVFTSSPITVATAGETYIYNVVANDPDGTVVSYLLYDAPEGMAIADDGTLTWNPTTNSPVQSNVTIFAYDSRGGRGIQEFSIAVENGNDAPVFFPLPDEIRGREGELLEVTVGATDADGDTLLYWADNLPPGAVFDTDNQTLSWTPNYTSAGTYEDVTFTVSDGLERVSLSTTVLIEDVNVAPTLAPIADMTVVEGETVRIELIASDPDLDSISNLSSLAPSASSAPKLTYSSNLLPGGAVLNPNTGVMTWTPDFFASGEYAIPFTVSDGESSTTEIANISVLNDNGEPVFDNLGDWAIAEGQSLRFRAFAFDPDNPSFVPQERNASGDLTILEGSEPTVNYSVSNLPEGASFDPVTAIFSWTPTFSDAGDYSVTFTATDDGDGLQSESVSVTVPISVQNINRAPSITPINNQTLQRGESLDLTVTATDADDDALTLSATGTGGFGLPDFASFEDNGDGTASLSFNPGDGDRGDYPIYVTAIDSGNVFTEYSFIVSVEAFNEAPNIEYIGDRIAVIGEPLDVLVRVEDLDEDDLTFTAISLPDGATLSETNIYGQARLQWTPTAADEGVYPITLQVNDSGNGDSNRIETREITFDLIVRSTNTAPSFDAWERDNLGEGAISITENETLSFNVVAIDPDGDALTYRAIDLPRDATFDPATGAFNWTPSYLSAAQYDFEVEVSDGHSSDSVTIPITVINNNRPPVINPLPLQSTRENNQLQFTINATDIDGDPIIYSAVDPLPLGASLDSLTGEFDWTPNYYQAGTYNLEIAAIDAEGLQSTTTLALAVSNFNRTPILEVKPQIVTLGDTLEFTLDGYDPDLALPSPNSDPDPVLLEYSAVNLPEGAVLDSTTGEISWTPSPGQLGDFIVTYQVSDGEVTVEQNALIRVETSATPPTVDLEFTPSFPAIPGQRVTINALADSFTEIEEITLTVNGEEVALNERNRAEFVPQNPGRIEVTATATDAAGRENSITEVLKVRDPQDSSDPIVAFGLGLDEAVISDETQITGTVADTNLDEWLLTVRDAGAVYPEVSIKESEKSQTLATGYGTINNDVLAAFDPALYTDGFYVLQLRATDIAGRSTTTEIVVEVNSRDEAGNVAPKTAQYQRLDNDLSVTLGDTTIDLVRRYDSLQQDERGSFGYGWTLANVDFDLQSGEQGTGNGEQEIVPLRDGSRVYLTLPDGERVGFTFAPVATKITGVTYYSPAWVADTGVGYTLESTDVLLSKGGDRYYDLKTAAPYNPDSSTDSAYTLTAPDGTIFKLDATGQVEEQITSSGTQLIISDSGILNPESGEAVRFTQDFDGRLSQITAPDGTAIRYSYDDLGNLIGVRNVLEGEAVRYGYVEGNDGAYELFGFPEETAPWEQGTGNSRLNLIAGDTGSAIAYFDTPQVLPVRDNLGTASEFVGDTVTGDASEESEDRYIFSFRESEIRSTATDFVYLGVDVTGSDVIPNIEGLTPVSTVSENSSSFALFAIEKEGLNLLSIDADSAYELKLAIAGDVNGDGSVNGFDSRLLSDAVTNNAPYSRELDINRDGVIDGVDISILGSNYGFTTNKAPTISSTTALTHEDLSVEIPLAGLGDDPEGDEIFYQALNPVNGEVRFAPDGETVVFVPTPGYSGTASFELIADDGFARSDAATIEIEVSDAPLREQCEKVGLAKERSLFHSQSDRFNTLSRD